MRAPKFFTCLGAIAAQWDPGVVLLRKPPLDDLEREQRLGESALQSVVVPTSPTIKQAALNEQRVNEDGDRRGPGGKPYLIAHSQCIGVPIEEIFRFLVGIALLRGKPVCEQFAVVVIDRRIERLDIALNR
jgi:hypothetical protein